MPRFWAGAIFAAMTLGCRDSHQAVVDRQIAHWSELTAILKTVKDDDTMQAAQGQIEARLNDFRDTVRRAKALPPPDDGVRLQLSAKAGEMQKAIRAFQVEAARVAGLPGGPEFIERIREAAGMKDPSR
jgi:hypothetical protein